MASVEAVFWAAALKVGATNVVKSAAKAGIRTLDGGRVDVSDPKVDGSVALGRYRVSVLDQAAAYATFANGGVHREPYIVSQVIDQDGKTVLWDHASHVAPPARAWSAPVAQDVSHVLQQSYAAEPGLSLGRPAAVKTGGQAYGTSSDSWAVGYTPQLATAVPADRGLPGAGPPRHETRKRALVAVSINVDRFGERDAD